MNKIIKGDDELVFIQNKNAFTNSEIISIHAGIAHRTVQQITEKYKSDFEEFGKLKHYSYKIDKFGRGRARNVYLYNEQQATLLLTYLKNTQSVRDFKKLLVRQFYEAKKVLDELKTPEYKAIRETSKEITKNSMKLLKNRPFKQNNIKIIDHLVIKSWWKKMKIVIASKAISLNFTS